MEGEERGDEWKQNGDGVGPVAGEKVAGWQLLVFIVACFETGCKWSWGRNCAGAPAAVAPTGCWGGRRAGQART